jgi:sugar lactone lactonase YvrE
MAAAPVSVCAVHATLGEGPVWIAREAALYFVDIKARKLFRFDPASHQLDAWDAPAQIGWVLPAADGGLVAGLQGGIHRFDARSGAFAPVVPVEADRPSNRLNDACTDPQGRIWFGTMDDGERGSSGAYYSYYRGMLAKADLPPVAITNGPAVSPDGRTLYHVDTRGGGIYACALEENGLLGPSRLFARIDPADGHPDGPTVDSEGCLWVGLFGSGEARRYAPDGSLVRTVRFPVSNITKLAFGGPDLRTVFATTARLHLSKEQLEREPEAGNLFSFRAEVPGIAVTPAVM